MKHVKSVTVAKAHYDDPSPGETAAILDSIFGFVLDLVDLKGKTGRHI